MSTAKRAIEEEIDRNEWENPFNLLRMLTAGMIEEVQRFVTPENAKTLEKISEYADVSSLTDADKTLLRKLNSDIEEAYYFQESMG